MSGKAKKFSITSVSVQICKKISILKFSKQSKISNLSHGWNGMAKKKIKMNPPKMTCTFGIDPHFF